MKANGAAFLILLLVSGIAGVAYGQTAPPQIRQVQPPPSPTPIINQPTAVAPRIIDPNAPPQGSITITLPPEGQVWYTGSYQRIEWTCSGTRTNSVDVGFWKDGKLHTAIGTGIATGRTAYKIPVDFPAGNYELRVTLSEDARIAAKKNETIVPATLTLTAPKSAAVMATGSTYPILWQYQGDSGPIKIELATAAGGAPLMIASNVSLSAGLGNGRGQFDWQVFENLSPAANYLVKITSLGSSFLTSTSAPFSIVKPSIKITSPKKQESFLSGVYVPIEWDYIGNNFGNQVHITAALGNAASPNLDVVNLPMGTNGHGGYRWMPPSSAQNQEFFIRVESVQNRSIFDQVTAIVMGTSASAAQQSAQPANQISGSSGQGAGGIGAQSGSGGAIATSGGGAVAGQTPLLQRAVAIFDTQDENKDKDTAVSVQVKTRGGRMAADILSAAASNTDATVFRPYTTAILNLRVYPGIRLSECNDLALWVDVKTVGTDTWRFNVRVEMYFADGTKVIKSSAKVVERGGFYLPPAQPIYGEILGPTQVVGK